MGANVLRISQGDCREGDCPESSCEVVEHVQEPRMSMPESAASGRDNHDQKKDSTGARLYSIIVGYVVYLGTGRIPGGRMVHSSYV